MATVMLDFMRNIYAGSETDHGDKLTVTVSFWTGRDAPSGIYLTPDPGNERDLAKALRDCADKLDRYADKRAQAAEFDPALLDAAE